MIIVNQISASLARQIVGEGVVSVSPIGSKLRIAFWRWGPTRRSVPVSCAIGSPKISLLSFAMALQRHREDIVRLVSV